MLYLIELSMKRIFKYIAAALAMPLFALGCTTEILTPDKGQLPEASELEAVIDVDQTTNYVTFSVTNSKGLVPMWIFGEELIDGEPNKRYSYTGNGISLRIREAGEHKVELRAYNANGVSIGAKILSFTLENTYRDPFDASPYMKAITGEWQWNNEVAGHFGCGGSIANPYEWWAAGANEKADWSLYDDRMTFTADGKYFFDPGDGQVYVHNSFTATGSTTPDGNDYLINMEPYETTYTIENNWNEAGIEEIWLVLPAQKNLSYIPHDAHYADPRWMFMETKTPAMKKELKLATSLCPNGEGVISWYYNFIPAVKVVTPEELLAGTDAEGKAWIMDSEVKGHLGCGETPENPAGWWSANAGEKTGTGLYDDAITFFPDGKYVYDSGADGKMYINWGVTVIGPNPGAEPDIDIEWPVTESTYEFDGETITLAPNTPMIYVPSDAMWANPVFKVTAISETSLTVVAMNEGCYWQMIFKARDIKAPSGPTLNGTELPAEISVGQGEVLEVGNLNLADIWVDPDFFEADGNNLKFKAVDGDYQFTYDSSAKMVRVAPMVDGARATYDNGKALWIIGDGGGKPHFSQAPGWSTGDAPLAMARIAENKYQITLHMKGENGSIKIFGQSDWGIEWKHNMYGTINGNGLFKIGDGSGGDLNDDGNIYHTGSPEGFYTFTVVDNGGILDFTVESLKQTVWDPTDSEHNMWLNMNVLSLFYFYNPGWAHGDAGTTGLAMEQDGSSYVVTIPDATDAQWQAQFAFKTDMKTVEGKTYDFMCKLVSNQDHSGVTIKLVLDGDDNTFYFADRHVLTADEEYVYKMEAMPGINMDKINLFFDFGGCAAGTEVTISDILFQEHRAE